MVQVGGPTGAVLPARLLDTPLDNDALAQVGAFVGSGSIKVLDDNSLRRRLCARADDLPFPGGVRQVRAVPAGDATGWRRRWKRIVSGLGRKTDIDLLQEYRHGDGRWLAVRLRHHGADGAAFHPRALWGGLPGLT